MSGARASLRRSRPRFVAIASTLAICGALITVPGIAATADDIADTGAREVMRHYPAAEFAAEALALPTELVASLDADLGITGEEYLAQSEAATQAVVVVESLQDAGVDVLGSRIDGTTLTVNVPSESEVTAVEAAGAVAVIGEPEPFTIPDLPLTFTADPVSNFYGGQGYYFESGAAAYRCTSGFNGFSASGAQQFVSAGHCVLDALSSVRALTMTSPNQTLTSATLGSVLGTAVPNSATLGGGSDAGLVNITNASVRPQGSVLTWGQGAGAPLSSTPVAITGKSAAIIGANVCKSGSSTGWACGTVLDVDYSADVQGKIVNSVVTTACTVQGDSGGALVSGGQAIGVTSWATDVACSNPDFASGAFPMVSGASQSSVSSLYGANWALAVTVPAPVVTSADAPQPGGAPITGTLTGAAAGSTVGLYLDGSASPFATVSVSGGAWSIPMTSVPSGPHIYRVIASSGFSRSAAVLVGLSVDRISGTDRVDTAIKVSLASYPVGSPTSIPVVYVTTGRNYPDALSAAPAAATQGGVLLLTEPTALPESVRAEIVRLNPAKIVVVGGTNSVSSSVYSALRNVQSNIVRIGGGDRYETSRLIVDYAFESAASAYVATGVNFPDALSASGAGGALRAPVVLVPGYLNDADTSTVGLLTRLGVSKITVVGGTASVTDGIKNALNRVAPTTRISGGDRFETSSNIAVAAFGSLAPTEIFLATGYNFPDALAGAVLAGTRMAPLIVVPSNCVPANVLLAMQQFGTRKVTLLGGASALTEDVAKLTQC